MSERGAQEPTAILLIEEYALLRESIGLLLADEPGFRIAAECASMAQGLEILKKQPIDVVLLEVDSREREAANFLRAARRRGFKSRLLLLAAEPNETREAGLIRAGVCGVFYKDESAAALRHAIRDVAAGNIWFRQEPLQRALIQGADALSPFAHRALSSRQRRVLSLVCEGLKNQEIAAQINVSVSSVKATLQQLFSKLGARSRSRLVRIGLQRP